MHTFTLIGNEKESTGQEQFQSTRVFYLTPHIHKKIRDLFKISNLMTELTYYIKQLLKTNHPFSH